MHYLSGDDSLRALSVAGINRIDIIEKSISQTSDIIAIKNRSIGGLEKQKFNIVAAKINAFDAIASDTRHVNLYNERLKIAIAFPHFKVNSPFAVHFFHRETYGFTTTIEESYIPFDPFPKHNYHLSISQILDPFEYLEWLKYLPFIEEYTNLSGKLNGKNVYSLIDSKSYPIWTIDNFISALSWKFLNISFDALKMLNVPNNKIDDMRNSLSVLLAEIDNIETTIRSQVKGYIFDKTDELRKVKFYHNGSFDSWEYLPNDTYEVRLEINAEMQVHLIKAMSYLRDLLMKNIEKVAAEIAERNILKEQNTPKQISLNYKDSSYIPIIPLSYESSVNFPLTRSIPTLEAITWGKPQKPITTEKKEFSNNSLIIAAIAAIAYYQMR